MVGGFRSRHKDRGGGHFLPRGEDEAGAPGSGSHQVGALREEGGELAPWLRRLRPCETNEFTWSVMPEDEWEALALAYFDVP